mmetsp:Transcript_24192/g.38362  ORF Transcript_24192/g.38362 Transcript_24192/m.38362 type:complete len:243 (+) Transcript_24192:368-1096(+)
MRTRKFAVIQQRRLCPIAVQTLIKVLFHKQQRIIIIVIDTRCRMMRRIASIRAVEIKQIGRVIVCEFAGRISVRIFILQHIVRITQCFRYLMIVFIFLDIVLIIDNRRQIQEHHTTDVGAEFVDELLADRGNRDAFIIELLDPFIKLELLIPSNFLSYLFQLILLQLLLLSSPLPPDSPSSSSAISTTGRRHNHCFVLVIVLFVFIVQTNIVAVVLSVIRLYRLVIISVTTTISGCCIDIIL